MRTVPAEFTAAQAKQTRFPKKQLLAILRNQARDGEGAVASSSGDYSTDYPAAGANDGKATHLSFGPAASADDGIGLGGWASNSAKGEGTIEDPADWNGGTQTNVITIDDAVELAFNTSLYDEYFDPLTTGPLVPQAGWTNVAVTGGATINVDPTAAYGGQGKGLRLQTAGSNTNRTDQKSISFGTNVVVSWRQRVIVQNIAQSTVQNILFWDSSASLYRFALRNPGGDNIAEIFDGTSWFDNDVLCTCAEANDWGRYTIFMDRTTPASTPIKVWFQKDDGSFCAQIYSGTIDTTGIDTIRIQISRGAAPGVDADNYIDDLRIGDAYPDSGTQENVFDLSAAPASARAQLSFDACSYYSAGYIAGASYPLRNADTAVAIRYATTQTMVAQTFTPSERKQIDCMVLWLDQAGGPSGNVWVEIRTVSGGLPTNTILASSRQLTAFTIGTPGSAWIFHFPHSVLLQSGVQYAFVVNANYALSTTAHVLVGVDGSAPTYTGGQGYYYDETVPGWVAFTPGDVCFVMYQVHEPGTYYSEVNQDTWAGLRAGVSTAAMAQGFKVPYTGYYQHFYLYIRKDTGATFTTGDYVWAEVQGADANDRPDNQALARSALYDPANMSPYPTFELFCFSMAKPTLLTAGVQYFVVVTGNYAYSGTNLLNIGLDNSSPSYPDGALHYGVDSGGEFPVWQPATAQDMIFYAMTPLMPWVRFEAAYSSDGISYSSYQVITDGTTRERGNYSITADFTGERKRYWKIKAELRKGVQTGQPSLTPRLNEYTLTRVFQTEKWLAIDFGSGTDYAVPINMVEAYAHHQLGGCRSFRLEGKESDAGSWTNLDDLTGIDIDMITTEARKAGGEATISYDSTAKEFTTDGDYFRVQLTALASLTDLRVVITDNIDEFARILELRARRVEDFTRRILRCRIAAQSEFSKRRDEAKSLNLVLDNGDYHLSVLRTEGGFNDQLGAGVEFILYVGYEGVSFMLKYGTYYVASEWVERPAPQPVITVTARDLAHRMDRNVTAKVKTGWRNAQIIEYLGNLAEVPSQDMIIDTTANSIDYFAPKEVNAWQEIQKVAEAAGFGRVEINQDDYMVFRATGMTSNDTRLPTVSGPTVIYGVRSHGVEFNGKIYYVGSVGIGAGIYLGLFEYDPVTTEWTYRTIAESTQTGVYGFSYEYDGALYIVWNYSQLGQLRLYRWDGGTTFTQLSRGQASGSIGELYNLTYMTDGYRIWLKVNVAGTLVELNVVTYAWTYRVFTGTITNCQLILDRGIVQEQGKHVSCPNDDRILEIDFLRLTMTQRIYLDLAPSITICTGIAATGLGYVYMSWSDGDPPVDAYIWRIDVSTWTYTRSDRFFKRNVAFFGSRVQLDAGAYYDGFAFFSGIENTQYQRMMLMEERAAGAQEIASPGSINLGPARVIGMRTIVREGIAFMYALLDWRNVWEFQVRRKLSRQDTPVFDFDISNLMDAGLASHGVEGDQQLIVTGVFVRSKPLYADPVEIQWRASDLPWGIVGGGMPIRLDCQLFEACVPDTTVNITYGGGGSATTSATHKSSQIVDLIITPTVSGTIDDLTLQRQPIREKKTILAIAVSPTLQRGRYELRTITIDNPYVYDITAARAIAAAVLLQLQSPRPRVTGVNVFAPWNLERYDRVRVTDFRTGLSSDDFYVVGFNIDFMTQRMQPELIRVDPKP